MKNQKGFGVAKVLLAAIAVLLVVGVGLYIVNANKDDTKSETPTTTQPTSTEQVKVTDQPTSTEQVKVTDQPKVEYIEFKDLGIKIKKTDKMSDWSFVDENLEDIGLKTKNVLSAADVKRIEECQRGSENPYSDKPFGSFYRLEGTYTPDKRWGSTSLAKQFDTFYILFSVPNGGERCGNEKGVGYPMFLPKDAVEALSEALQDAEKI